MKDEPLPEVNPARRWRWDIAGEEMLLWEATGNTRRVG